MKSLVAVSAVAAVLFGCGAYVPQDPNTSANIWLDQDNMGYEAQQTWGLPLTWTPKFAFLEQAELQVKCHNTLPPGDMLAACTDVEGGTIWLDAGHDPADLPRVLLHEMGHAISLRAHIKSPGCSDYNEDSLYVMCTHGAILTVPTQEDFDFVTWADRK